VISLALASLSVIQYRQCHRKLSAVIVSIFYYSTYILHFIRQQQNEQEQNRIVMCLVVVLPIVAVCAKTRCVVEDPEEASLLAARKVLIKKPSQPDFAKRIVDLFPTSRII